MEKLNGLNFEICKTQAAFFILYFTGCYHYLPLIGGETTQKYEHGLPVHMVIERS